MKLCAPSIDLDSIASESKIEKAICGIAGKDNPFVILERDTLTYLQSLWTESGYVVQFQEGSIDKHFEFTEPFTAEHAIKLFSSYLNDEPNWHQDNEFARIEISSTRFKLGYTIGNFFGSLLRGFRDAREK